MMKGPLIGLDVMIIDSKNLSLIGFKGKVTNETKNILVIADKEKKEKKFIKTQITIKIQESGEIIDSESLVGRPEERIKSKVKK